MAASLDEALDKRLSDLKADFQKELWELKVKVNELVTSVNQKAGSTDLYEVKRQLVADQNEIKEQVADIQKVDLKAIKDHVAAEMHSIKTKMATDHKENTISIDMLKSKITLEGDKIVELKGKVSQDQKEIIDEIRKNSDEIDKLNKLTEKHSSTIAQTEEQVMTLKSRLLEQRVQLKDMMTQEFDNLKNHVDVIAEEIKTDQNSMRTNLEEFMQLEDQITKGLKSEMDELKDQATLLKDHATFTDQKIEELQEYKVSKKDHEYLHSIVSEKVDNEQLTLLLHQKANETKQTYRISVDSPKRYTAQSPTLPIRTRSQPQIAVASVAWSNGNVSPTSAQLFRTTSFDSRDGTPAGTPSHAQVIVTDRQRFPSNSGSLSGSLSVQPPVRTVVYAPA